MTGAARIVIVGAGGVGCVVGARLADLGYSPRFVGKESAEVFSRTIVGPDGQERRYRWEAASRTDLGHAELVLVTVRAVDLDEALASILAQARVTAIWPLANGATEESVMRAARAAANSSSRPSIDADPKAIKWRLGFATLAVTALGDGRYALRSKSGAIHVGPLFPKDPPTPLEASLAKQDFVFWHDPIQPHQRKKWLFNSTINTLAAARRLRRNGDLLADIPMLAAVFAEAYALGESLWGPWPEDARAMYEAMLKLIEETATNENSMARDRRIGRPSEARWLAGLARDERSYPLLVRLCREIDGTAATKQ